VLKTDHGLDGDSLSYLDQMERSQDDENRRARERVIMDEGRVLWEHKKREEEEMAMKDLHEIRELSKNKIFGRPGHGAPTYDIRKKKFTEHQLDHQVHHQYGGGNSWDDEPDFAPAPTRLASRHERTEENPPGDALTFGRSGAGAPMRSKSGRIRTTIVGNPEIRFQANEGVQKSISNNIRYATDPNEKAVYHKELEEQIRQRKDLEFSERKNNIAISKALEQDEGLQWGAPGPGGSYWRPSALTGQGFFDKMGWSGSADPRKRQCGIKNHEAEDIKREMEDVQARKVIEHNDINSNVGLELVPLMKDKFTGKPRKDPSTGYMMSHSLHSTDVTKLADRKGTEYAKTPLPEERHKYWETLTGQVSEKNHAAQAKRELDDQQQRRHYESYDSFWGRPGYGAPRGQGNGKKENLMKMLHYPEKAPNNVELITLERLPVK